VTLLHDFKATAIDGEEVSLDEYAGDVVLVVNTASECGYTPQLGGLETLYETYRDRGLTVLGFPCNQFGGQDPGSDDEIGAFCQKNYGVTFPMFSKVDVNGPN
jgi:glutathione peroxidase